MKKIILLTVLLLSTQISTAFASAGVPFITEDFEGETIGLFPSGFQNIKNSGAVVSNVDGSLRLLFRGTNTEIRVQWTGAGDGNATYLEGDVRVLQWNTTASFHRFEILDRIISPTTFLSFQHRLSGEGIFTVTNFWITQGMPSVKIPNDTAQHKFRILICGDVTSQRMIFWLDGSKWYDTVTDISTKLPSANGFRGLGSYKANVWYDNLALYSVTNFPVFPVSFTTNGTGVTLSFSNSFNMNLSWQLYRASDNSFSDGVAIGSPVAQTSATILFSDNTTPGGQVYYRVAIADTPFHSLAYPVATPYLNPLTLKLPLQGQRVDGPFAINAELVSVAAGSVITLYRAETDEASLPSSATPVLTTFGSNFTEGVVVNPTSWANRVWYLYLSATNGVGTHIAKTYVERISPAPSTIAKELIWQNGSETVISATYSSPGSHIPNSITAVIDGTNRVSMLPTGYFTVTNVGTLTGGVLFTITNTLPPGNHTIWFEAENGVEGTIASAAHTFEVIDSGTGNFITPSVNAAAGLLVKLGAIYRDPSATPPVKVELVIDGTNTIDLSSQYSFSTLAPAYHYPMDEVFGPVADTGNSNHNGTWVSGTKGKRGEKGVIGNSYYLEDSFVRLGTSESFTKIYDPAVFSIAAWVKLDLALLNDYEVFFSKGYNYWDHAFFIDKNKNLRAEWRNIAKSSSGIGEATEAWMHVAVAFDKSGTKKSKLYLNGEEVPVYSKQDAMTTWDLMTGKIAAIGACVNNDGITARSFFKGWVDDVRFYDANLSAAQVKQIMNVANIASGISYHWEGTLSPGEHTWQIVASNKNGVVSQSALKTIRVTTAGFEAPLAIFPCDEKTGSNVTDTSINGKNGKFTGKARTEGFSGMALLLREDTDALFLTNTLFSSGTLFLRVNPEDFSQASATRPQFLFSHFTGSANPFLGKNLLQIYVDDPAGTLKMKGGNDGKIITSVTSLPIKKWSSITALWSITNFSLYVNGEQTAETTFNGLIDTSEQYIIGNGGESLGNDLAFFGKIDEVMIFASPLSPDKIRAIHNRAGEQEAKGNIVYPKETLLKKVFQPSKGGIEISLSQVPAKGEDVSISICRADGVVVRILGIRESSSVTWDGKDESGKLCPTGSYFILVGSSQRSFDKTLLILVK